MSRILKITLLTSLFMLFAMSGFAQWQTFVVDDNGNPLTTYPTLAQAFATAAAYPGGPHVIEIRAGAYAGANLTVPNNVGTVVGAGSADVVFTAPGGTSDFLYMNSVEAFTVSGLTLVGYDQGFSGTPYDGLTISGVVFDGVATGLDLTNCLNGDFSDLYFVKCGTGMGGNGYDDVIFGASAFDTCTAAIYVFDCDGGDFTGLTVMDGTDGIKFGSGCENNTVSGCTISNNSGVGFGLYDADNNTIEDNGVYGNGSYGLEAGSAATGNTIQDNCFVGNLSPQGFDNDSNTWDHNYYDYDDIIAATHALAGSGGSVDTDPWLIEVNANATTPQETQEQFTVALNWEVPPCAQDVYLGAYSFTLHYTSRVHYVSAAYDPTAFGDPDPAFYGPIVHDAGARTVTFEAVNFDAPWTGDIMLGSAVFEGDTTGYVNFWVTSEYLGLDQYDTLVVGNTLKSVLLVDTEAPDMITFIANDPVTGTDTYSDGSTAGAGPFVACSLQFAAEDNIGLLRLEYSWDGTTFYPYFSVTGVNWTNAPNWLYLNVSNPVSYPDGDYTIYVRAVDLSNNESTPMSYSFKLDRVGPVITADAYDADGCAPDAAFTDDVNIKVALATTDAGIWEYQVREDGFSYSARAAWASPVDFILSAGAALKTVRARAYDRWNNLGAGFSDNIELDETPAALAFDMGFWKTNAATLTVTGTELSYGTQTAELAYIVSMDPMEDVSALSDCFAGGWMTPPAFPFTIDLTGGDGVYYIWFGSKDRAGNMQTPVLDSVKLDMTPPDLLTFDLADQEGDDCSEKTLVDWVFTWSGADALTLQTTVDTTTPATWYTHAGFVGPADPATFTSSLAMSDVGDGTYTRFARITDDIGNFSDVVEASIVIDRVAPTVYTVTCADPTPTGFDATWSNSATIDVHIAGGDMDSVMWAETSAGLTTAAYAEYVDPMDFQVTRTDLMTGLETKRVYAMGRDCAHNTTARNSNNLKFDLHAPVWVSMDINGVDTMTNSTAVIVNVSFTEANFWKIEVSEDNTFTINVSTWTVNAVAYAFNLQSGDGGKTVYARVTDMAGNTAVTSAYIRLDATPPVAAATSYVKAANPLAIIDWTDDRNGNMAYFTFSDADVDAIWIQNSDGTGATNWVTPAAAPVALNQLIAGQGSKTLRYWLRDEAGNYDPAGFTHSLMYSSIAPLPPAMATMVAVPKCLQLDWPHAADVQKWHLRFNFTGDYPLYDNGVAPHPTTMGEGIFMAEVSDTTYEFATGDPDIYSVSCWTLGNNGMYSLTPNTDVIAPNYINGDFIDLADTTMGQDDCLDFEFEFFMGLGLAYNSDFGDAEYNAYVDIAPTIDGGEFSYAVPDSTVDFDDAVMFAIIYADPEYRCTSLKHLEPNKGDMDKPAVSGPVAMITELPEYVKAGSEYTVSVKADNAAGIFAYHTVFNYNRDVVEVVKVDPGDMYRSVEQSFFYHDAEASNIDVASVILGDYIFSGEEMFRVTFKAKTSGPIEMEKIKLDVRSIENEQIDANFSVSKNTGMLPTSFALAQNYPNPFNPTTSVEFALPVASDYSLTIYNITGQVVERFGGSADAGIHTIEWDASSRASGIYFYKLEAGTFSDTKKMVLIK